MGKRWARQQAKENVLATKLERVTLWLRYRPQTALWGAIGILVAIFVGVSMLNRRSAVKEESWSKLSVAQSYAAAGQGPATMQQIQSLSQEHPTSQAAGFGMLLAADILYQQQQFTKAAETYERLVNEARHEAVVPLAMAGLGISKEASGDCNGATGIDQRFLDGYQDHFLAPQVHASLARCLTALGQDERAKATYERIEFLYPNTYWAGWAKARKG